MKAVTKPSSPNRIAVRVPQANGCGSENASSLGRDQSPSPSPPASDVELASRAGSRASSGYMLSSVPLIPTLLVPSLESGKVSELELPSPLYKDYQADYRSQVALEKFILLKLKEYYKENKQLRSQLAAVKDEIKRKEAAEDEQPEVQVAGQGVQRLSAGLIAQHNKLLVQYQSELQVQTSAVYQLKERVRDLQCDLAVQLASVKELSEALKATIKEVDRLTDSNEFQKKKCTLYQKLVKDWSLKGGFELPAERWKLMSCIENQQLDDVKKDIYTNAEREAAEELYAKQQTIAGDPYLLYEVNKVHKVCNRKY